MPQSQWSYIDLKGQTFKHGIRLIHGNIRVSPAGPESAFSLQPVNVIIIFLQLVSDSLAEKDAVERDYLALVAGDRRGRRFHLVCRHANSRLSSASPVAGRRFGRVCIFTGARCQSACPKKGASTPGCHYRVWSVCPGCSALAVGVVPSLYTESVKFSSALPGYMVRGWGAIESIFEQNLEKFPQLGGNRSPSATPEPEPNPKAGLARYQNNPYVQQSLQYFQEQLPSLVQRCWAFIQTSLTGVFGVFGFMFGLLMVPIYLFFLLKESPRIAESWSNYLPLRRSEFKDEVVTVLTEINGYLINFFRGQLVVALINAVLLAIGLSIVGLQFGFLIGLGFAFFGIIPYVGYIICYIPAVLIAFAQFNDWAHPLWVTIIFFLIVAQIDGLLTTPRIVGNSVGLHPMTVIMSVFLWTLVFGGLLGAVLAIPLTATLKVLLHRYV